VDNATLFPRRLYPRFDGPNNQNVAVGEDGTQKTGELSGRGIGELLAMMITRGIGGTRGALFQVVASINFHCPLPRPPPAKTKGAIGQWVPPAYRPAYFTSQSG
jgi:hypothetical protein